MRSFGRLWVMVMCVIIALSACTDDKQIEKVRKAKKELEQIEAQKRQEEEKKKEEERKKREEEEKKQEEERKKKEEEERKKREEEEQKKKEEEERKKKEEEERKKREEEEKKKKEEEEEKKKKEEEAKFKVLEGVYSGKRTSGENGQSQIDEVFNVTIGYSKEDKKWNVTFSSVKIQKTAALITQEEDKLIFYVEWSYYYDYSTTLLFTPSLKKLKITTTCEYPSRNWTYEGTKQ